MFSFNLSCNELAQLSKRSYGHRSSSEQRNRLVTLPDRSLAQPDPLVECTCLLTWSQDSRILRYDIAWTRSPRRFERKVERVFEITHFSLVSSASIPGIIFSYWLSKWLVWTIDFYDRFTLVKTDQAKESIDYIRYTNKAYNALYMWANHEIFLQFTLYVYIISTI